MICKFCGYEDSKNFSVCPFCGESNALQNQNNQNNSYNPPQYQTSVTNPNFQNNQYNQGNQNNNNLVSPNNYQNQPNRRVARHYPNYGSNMPEYFRGNGSSFEINQDDIIITRDLNGGDFAFWRTIFIALLFLALFFLGILIGPLFFGIIETILKSEFLFILSFILFCTLILGINFLIPKEKIRVNSTGITIKTTLKEYFIPKEKIDFVECRTVTRTKHRTESRYGRRYSRTISETFYDVFIIMKDRSVCNKMELDTGLCYKNKTHVDYLVDEFNERLGFLL